MSRFDHHGVRGLRLDQASHLLPLGRIDLIATRQHDHVGPLETAQRLAQQAARKQPAVAPGCRGVDQHQVEIAGQPPVLEAVVEHQHFAFEFFAGGLRQRGAIGPLQVRHVGQVLLQHQRLVVGAGRAAVA